MAGVLILVKSDREVPLLHPVTALHYDHKTGMVYLDREVDLVAGSTQWVPLNICYEFDADLMDLVNNLLRSSIDRICAAVQLEDARLVPQTFDAPDGADEPIKS
jgi:hypothetical protein